MVLSLACAETRAHFAPLVALQGIGANKGGLGGRERHVNGTHPYAPGEVDWLSYLIQKRFDHKVDWICEQICPW